MLKVNVSKSVLSIYFNPILYRINTGHNPEYPMKLNGFHFNSAPLTMINFTPSTKINPSLYPMLNASLSVSSLVFLKI